MPLGQVSSDGSAGRSDHLAAVFSDAQTQRMVGSDVDHRWNGDRHQTVLAMHIAGTFIQFGDNRLADVQIVQADGSGNDIDNRVYRSYLMEMHLVLRDAMCFGFGRRNNPEDVPGSLFGALCNGSAIDDGKDITDVAVNMAVPMGMNMIVRVLMIMWMLMVMRVLMTVFMLFLYRDFQRWSWCQ